MLSQHADSSFTAMGISTTTVHIFRGELVLYIDHIMESKICFYLPTYGHCSSQRMFALHEVAFLILWHATHCAVVWLTASIASAPAAN
jgi:hypothetical protein